MIRDALGNQRYWDETIACYLKWMDDANLSLSNSSRNKVYGPQFSFDLSKDIFRLITCCYSRGDDVGSIGQYFSDVIKKWEMSNDFSEAICAEYELKNCRSWNFNLSDLNHYNWCFWLVGLALALEIPDDQWRRLLVLIDGEGEDELLDRIINSREKNRRVGTVLLHPKPYSRLLMAINAPKEQQAVLLRDFVEHWYVELAREEEHELWWYFYGDPVIHPLEMGSYFGRWCLEAVAAVKAFGIDDSQCLGHEHYPGDLLRPDGPTTHPVRNGSKAASWISRVLKSVKSILSRKVNYKQ